MVFNPGNDSNWQLLMVLYLPFVPPATNLTEERLYTGLE